MNKTDDDVDVVVVGAGPVGLLSAIELTLAGVRVLVLERLAAASTVDKALGLGPLGVEALARRGMAAAIAAAEARTLAAMQQAMVQAQPSTRGPRSKFSGHFGALTLIRKDAQREPERRSRPVDQHAVEAMLAERARALGIEVRRGCALAAFAQRADGVDVDWTAPGGGGRIGCAYLLACDGGRSGVRKMAGFDFPGSAPTSTFYNVVAAIDHPERLLPGGWRRTAGGVFSYGFLPGRLVMLDFSGPPREREAPVTREEVEAVLRRISGADVRVRALEKASRWTDNTRLADSYRRGRVLLAGDAAHIHTPFGGQGMSLGLGDAANLGWKLGAVVRGDLPESLLDSYTAERRPVAEAVLANTLAQAAIMRPDPQAGAMRELMARLLDFDDVNRLIGEMTSGLATRYDLGASRDEVGRLVGDKALRHGALYALMQDGAAVFLEAPGGADVARRVAAAAPKIAIRCGAVDAGPSMLIRPDGCVAWAGDDDSAQGLEDALRRWFAPAASRF